MKKNIGFALLAVGLISSLTFQSNKKLEELDWLIGTWKISTSRGTSYETWIKKSDLEFCGKSFGVKDQDTIVFETIRLIQEKDQLFYIPTVENQNENKPVWFALKTKSDNEWVFENPEHDFPQRIRYARITEDSLIAEISGSKNGRERKQLFPMRRVN